jgi:hypothetical protein|tara:strand:+ start:293 stop:454 length:162 start_codon:yes stop_codon:yes gene_type:complete
MTNILIIYSGIITMLFVAIWIQNNNMFKEVLKEREHSKELRKTILTYLKSVNI